MAIRVGIMTLLVVLLCGLVSASEPNLTPEHQSAFTPIRPGLLRPVWQTTSESEVSEAHLAGHTVVTVTGNVLEGWDWYSGRLRWRTQTDLLVDWSYRLLPTRNLLLVAPEPDGKKTGGRAVIVNPQTGALLWTMRLGSVEQVHATVLGAGHGRIVVAGQRHRELWALGDADGAPAWRISSPPNCSFGSGAAEGGIAAVVVRCGREVRLRAVATTDGRQLWERAQPPAKRIGIEVHDGLVALHGTAGISVYDATGHQLLAYPPDPQDDECGCGVTIGADAVAVTRPGALDDELRLDLISRQSLARRSMKISADSQLVEVEGQIYVRETFSDTPVEIIRWARPDAGLLTVGPAPGDTPWLVTGGGGVLLIVSADYRNDSYTLGAYRTEAVSSTDPGLLYRDGVAASQWPDACALLGPEEIGAVIPGARYIPRPVAAPAELGLTTPAACDLEPARSSDPLIAVTVLWIFPSKHAAHRDLLAFHDDEGPPLEKIGDEAVRDSQTSDRLYLRVGAVLVRLDVPGHAEYVSGLGRRLAKKLRETG
ncbi:PQQ-binding-like beta-propeller repeat protein [Microbispora sp. H10885]|uniref:outer membrane protein assembly factor BamB family protein n=1 Tax=Microbispora sp. H10885 TaxID=2729110 RepID=UPI001601BAFB|nr:PQQ-binding-like beta-propeller repeat protein [Microbispora sp. H10885]